MTLGEYLNENADIKNFCILMLEKDDSMTTIECKDVSEVGDELTKCEFMEANTDDGTLGIWVR